MFRAYSERGYADAQKEPLPNLFTIAYSCKGWKVPYIRRQTCDYQPFPSVQNVDTFSLTQAQGHTHNVTEIQDVTEIIEQYRNSVAFAKEASFDGIELLSQGQVLAFQLKDGPGSHKG
jgi:hypothetical protein